MKRPLFHPYPALAAVLLGGCAATGSYPSLAPRAIEAPRAPEVVAPPAIRSDPQISARLAALLTATQAAQNDFTSALAKAQAAADGAGHSASSDRWIAAQTALSLAERAHAPLETALAALDDEQRSALARAISPADQDAITAARAKVESIAEQQRSALQALAAELMPR